MSNVNIITKIYVLVVVIAAGTASADLVGHWTFNEGSGSTANDSSGNGNDGFFRGYPKWTTGISGSALQFKGEDHIDCGNNASLNITGPLSITLWIRHESDATEVISPLAPLCKATSSTEGWSWQLRYGQKANDDKWVLGFQFNAIGGSVWVFVNQRLAPAKWYHVAASYDGKTVTCYLNGKKTDSARMTGLVHSAAPLLIGQSGWRQFWKGSIDDIRIYNHGLYEEEVKQLCLHRDGATAPTAFLRLTDEVHKARSIIEEQGPKRAITFYTKKISEYEKWKGQNTNVVELRHEMVCSELHFLLGKAHEAANAPTNRIAAAYRRAVSQPCFRRNYVPALLWLFKNTSSSDYADAIKKSTHNRSVTPEDIAEDFESSMNWTAFKQFMDATLTEVDQPNSYAEAIASGLRKGSLWADSFVTYAQSKPQLTQYIIATHEKRAQELMAQKYFLKAAENYRDIVDKCDSEKDKAAYGLKILECSFYNGQYRHALLGLSSFIEKNKATNEVLARDAVLLKAHAYIHLNDTGRSKVTLSYLVTNYPQTEQANEAEFYIGYCSMLQGKYGEAAEALNSVIRKSPESSNASRARLCLARIKKPTEEGV